MVLGPCFGGEVIEDGFEEFFVFVFVFSKEEGEGNSYGKWHKDNNFQGQES